MWVLRISVIMLLIGELGFKATAFAEVSAWTGALIMNMSAYIFYIRKYTKSNNILFQKAVTH